MIAGSVEMSDPNCAAIASRLRVVVGSVEYRLAPEHPYPEPLEDCYTGLQWMWTRAAELAIGGASAGGGLAASLALMARDRGEISLCYQHLIYPMLDHRNATSSSHAITDGRVWNRAANTVGWNAYFASEAGSENVGVRLAVPVRQTCGGCRQRTSVWARSTSSSTRTSPTPGPYARPASRSS